jgi:hypothetical protein
VKVFEKNKFTRSSGNWPGNVWKIIELLIEDENVLWQHQCVPRNLYARNWTSKVDRCRNLWGELPPWEFSCLYSVKSPSSAHYVGMLPPTTHTGNDQPRHYLSFSLTHRTFVLLHNTRCSSQLLQFILWRASVAVCVCVFFFSPLFPVTSEYFFSRVYWSSNALCSWRRQAIYSWTPCRSAVITDLSYCRWAKGTLCAACGFALVPLFLSLSCCHHLQSVSVAVRCRQAKCLP